MKPKFFFILFGLILIVAFVLRLYRLNTIPSGLYQDETAIGYNAYSILMTGRDEHGVKFPLYFKSFGDYKLPVYIYTTVLPIKLFGLTPFAVRLPSAVFGFLTIPVVYLLVHQLSKNRTLALITMTLVALNPWHIHYNRATFEVSMSLFFFTFGSLLLLRAHTKKTTGYFLTGSLFFVLSLYSYNLTRLLAPVLYILTLFYCRLLNEKPKRNELFVTAIICVLLLVPFVVSWAGPGGVRSSSGTLLFSSAAVQAPILEFRSYMADSPVIIRKFIFNNATLMIWQFVQHAVSYISVPFFFLTGSSHGNHGIGNTGQFYLVELPFFLLGIWSLLKEKARWGTLLSFWAAATVLIASLTREAPHATRSFFLIFPVECIVAYGILSLASSVTRPKITHLRFTGLAVIVLFTLFNIAYYLSSYFVRFPTYYAKSWRFQDIELSKFVREHESRYEKIIFDTKAGFMYTSLLYYNQIDPKLLQDTSVWSPDDSEGFSSLVSFDKYEFRDIDWTDDLKRPRTLIITTADQKPQAVAPLAAFYYPMRPVVFSVKQEIINYPIQDISYVAVQTQQ